MDILEPSWDLYRTFRAVLREGTLSGAARSLGLTQPTVGRHIDALEAATGRQLFLRSQRGLAPTDAALSLQPYAETLAATADALLRAASAEGEAIAGTVRISASEVAGVELLPPILAELRGRHPGLVIELALSDEVEDLLQRQADVAVRMVAPAQAALVARRVGTIPLGLHAHRDYLETHGTPQTVEELAHHSVIGFDRVTPAIRSFLAQAGGLSDVRFALRTDSNVAQLAAIRAGLGIGVCQVPIAARDPALVRVLPDAFTIGLETWVCMHENLRTTPRCRAVFDALVAGLQPCVEA